ncbi:MAG TPA: M36 family metallopeptidase, partial [Ferruginibacter sp.]|nr:M36 family metallopeptidase [Ferruginibacter sp.]
TVYCKFPSPAEHLHGADIKLPKLLAANQSSKSNQPDGYQKIFRLSVAANSPSIVNNATYKVIPFPAESPIHPGGTPAVVSNPWNAAAGNATSLKWHSNGTTDYNITRGNNVWAKEDLAASNSTTGVPATSTTATDPLSFNFTPDFNVSPTQTTPVPNQPFNITNLFYWNNIIHDVMYQYGFDEVSGNFQANNQGRGGAGNDFVLADAQDGNYVAPNQNNANFSTPADGSSGRMQMYLWDAHAMFTVNAPAVIAGSYSCLESNFSTGNKLANVGPVTGDVVYYNDVSGGLHEACVTPGNTLTGKIALIQRGNCNFTVKVKNAQDAGAIAVIMVNNVSGNPIIMGGTDNTITIPAVMISDVDGATMIAQLNNGLNVTLRGGPNLDGDVDNGVVVNEFGHGISNRLTGGPAQASCVSSAENMGEGWSDYI